MLHGAGIAIHGDGGVGVCAAGGVDEQGITFRVVPAAFHTLEHLHFAAVAGTALTNGDRFGHNVGGGFRGGVNHACAGVLQLAGVCKRDAHHLAAGAASLKHHGGVFHGEPGAQVAVNPADFSVFHGKSTLDNKVVYIGGPVLNGYILDFSPFERHEFHHAGVQGGTVVLRGGAAFHVHELSPFICNDEGALKLPHTFGIDTEIGLQRLGEFHAFGHIDK